MDLSEQYFRAVSFVTRIDTGDFSRLTAQSSKLSAEIDKMMKHVFGPLRQLTSQMQQQFDAAMEPLRNLAWLDEQGSQCELFEAAGWLPHMSAPLFLVEQHTADREGLDSAIEEYYRANHSKIRSKIASAIRSCAIDKEAQDTFLESLRAHRAGLYRCVPRLLFPEIERVARDEIHGGAMDKIASQERLRNEVSELMPRDMPYTGVIGLRLYDRLVEHLYTHVKDNAALLIIKDDPVPNRHAALHGLVCYKSFKSSMNCIVMTLYVFEAITAIKAYRDLQSDRQLTQSE